MVTSATNDNITEPLGTLVKRVRIEKHLTQEQLAAPQFTKSYISAVERHRIHPSEKALEVIADRLQLPLANLAAAPIKSDGIPDIHAMNEDLEYQYNYARMLMQSDKYEQAYDLISTTEQSARLFIDSLPPRFRYRPFFLRGFASLRLGEPKAAAQHLTIALAEAEGDEDSETRVRNLLGISCYLMGQPVEALSYHLLCRKAIVNGVIKDISLRLSILRNLANDYWALQDTRQAIGTYEEALTLVDDLDGTSRQADIYWALAMAYKVANNLRLSLIHSRRALELYESLKKVEATIIVCLHIADLLTQDGRYDEALEMLAKSSALLAAPPSENDGSAVRTVNKTLVSNLNFNYANLFRLQGDLQLAASYAAQGIHVAREAIRDAGENYPELLDALEDEAGDNQPLFERLSPLKDPAHPEYTPIALARAYSEALLNAALVEEDLGKAETADAFFAKALALIEQTGLAEMIHYIRFAYGDVLGKRGEYAKASEQYRIAALSLPDHVKRNL